MFRRLIDDFKEFPATMTIGAAWVVVFLLMLADRLQTPPLPNTGQVLLGNFTAAHRFGDMTLRELFQGEAWRAITCTFVHYNLLHIGMNLYGLYQLGALVESWYGPAQFVAVYALIGGGGNLLSGLIRRGIGSNPEIHSGGGSTVVLGLVALCAVVGWRSKSRIGDYLRSQMVGILVFTAVLGMLLPIVDNWGHAGGAIVGAAIGFGHRILIRTAQRSIALWAGGLAAIILVASGAAQVRENRLEDAERGRLRAKLERLEKTNPKLAQIELFYHLALQRAQFEHMMLVPKSYLPSKKPGRRAPGVDQARLIDPSDREFREALSKQLALLDSTKDELGVGPTADDFREVRRLLSHVFDRSPFTADLREFTIHLTVLARRLQRDETQTKAQYSMLAKSWPHR